MCSSLTSKIAGLKQEKHEYVVGVFAEEEKKLMEARLKAETTKIKEKYAGKRR